MKRNHWQRRAGELLLLIWAGAILTHISKSPDTLLAEIHALFEQQHVASLGLSGLSALVLAGLKPLVLFLGIVAGAWGLGRWLLKAFRYQASVGWVTALTGTALGFGLLIEVLIL